MINNKLKLDGINFVLLERSGKKPFQQGWQNKKIPYNDIELVSHINNKGNYGVMGGGEKNLIIVDFDSEKVQEEVIKNLPETFTVKTGSGLLHKYFFSDKSESFKIFDEEMNTLVDVQGEGKQVVGAGSIHPNGKEYELVEEKDIAFIDYSEIRAMLEVYNKKPKKEVKQFEKPKTDLTDDFLDRLKSYISVENVLNSFGVDTSKNPTQCPLHSSKGGKCLGFNYETAHCFHCDGSWNIFSLVKEMKKCDFKDALEYIADLGGLQKELLESRKKYIDSLKEKENENKNELLIKFLRCVGDKEIGEATELLVNYIKSHNHLFSTKSDLKSEMCIYEDGIYITNGKSCVKEMMRDVLGNFYNIYYLNQVINKIEADTFVDIDSFFNNVNVNEVPVKNGILNIVTRELQPFSPDKIFFNKLPVEYKPEAECNEIEKFLESTLGSEDDKNVFYELGGFCLLKEYKFEKAFMLVGDGRNGKDKTLELIKRTIGIENCCSVPLASLVPSSFIISEFFGKMCNIAGDIGHQDLKDTSVFKGLTGRSIQTAPRKFLNPITFLNYAKFIFACNKLPMVYDDSKGFWDRWVLLEFPYTFVTKEELDISDDKNFKLRDEGIIERITTPEELSGLLNKFLEGLERLTLSKTFSSTKGSSEIKNLWIRKSNSVMAFCVDMIEEDYDKAIAKKSFRNKYSIYCKTHKIQPKSDYVIKRTLQEMFGSIEGRGGVETNYTTTWEGIKWK